MEEGKTNQPNPEEAKLSGIKLLNGEGLPEDADNADFYSNVKIHGGCGLGGVTLLNNKPLKHEEGNHKIKAEGIIK